MTLNHRVRRTRVVHLPVLAVLVTLGVPGGAHAQGQGGRAPAGPPPSPKAAAPIDLTGYWVSIVTQDWRQRMVTPPRGDYESVPITAEAKKVGDGWGSGQG